VVVPEYRMQEWYDRKSGHKDKKDDFLKKNRQIMVFNIEGGVRQHIFLFIVMVSATVNEYQIVFHLVN